MWGGAFAGGGAGTGTRESCGRGAALGVFPGTLPFWRRVDMWALEQFFFDS